MSIMRNGGNENNGDNEKMRKRGNEEMGTMGN